MLEEAVIQQAEARVGRVLREKWRLDRLLGVGGMACVYAATHRNGLRGAVKMLHPELGMRADIRQRFFREGYMANKVDHPGAVRVLDDDDHEGAAFIVMELLDGENLDARAAARPSHALEIHEVISIGDALLDVLAAAHAKGIVHRDLKPENLFMTHQGQLKVLDFGIARVRDVSNTASTTSTGSVMGTPAFMPPEQALGKMDQIDGRTDLWAAGATMFALLTGQHVHEAANANQVLLAAMTHHARSVGSVRANLPPALVHVIDWALAFDCDRRWEDARSMQASLRLIAPGAFPTVPNEPSQERGFVNPASGQELPRGSMPSQPAASAPIPISGIAPTAVAAAPPVTAAPSHVSTSFNVNDQPSAADLPKRGNGGLIAFGIAVAVIGAGAVAGVVLLRPPAAAPASSQAASAPPSPATAIATTAASAPPPPEVAPQPSSPEPPAPAAPSAEPSASASAPVATATSAPLVTRPGLGRGHRGGRAPTAPPASPPAAPAAPGHKDHGF